MDKKILDVYSDFLFANSSQATATSFSDALDGRISHDKFSRFLREDSYTSKTLWENIKTDIRTADNDEKAILSFDDSIIEKPVQYCDLETRREKRKSLVTKNKLMREMFKTSLKNINFDYVLADNWFCCGKTLELINECNKKL